MSEGKFAQIYAKVRGSKAFLIGLCVFVFSWLAISHFTGFDSDHGLINLFLSFEASVSLAFFAVVSDKQYETLRAVLDAIKSEEDSILKEVSHDQL